MSVTLYHYRCYAELYEHTNFGGRKLTVHGEIGHLEHNSFNNAVSSAKIFGTCDWIFYEHDYHGDPCILHPGEYASTYAWGQADNILTSLIPLPPPGSTALVIFEEEFAGRVIVLHESTSDFGSYDFDNVASTYVVTGGTWCVYDFSDYEGRNETLYPGQYIAPGGHDYASSAKLL